MYDFNSNLIKTTNQPNGYTCRVNQSGSNHSKVIRSNAGTRELRNSRKCYEANRKRETEKGKRKRNIWKSYKKFSNGKCHEIAKEFALKMKTQRIEKFEIDTYTHIM